MAKRFTDNAKWCDPWYRKLSPLNKLAWLYITDNCDAAGVIDLDDELANFQIGCTVDWHDFMLAASDRLERLESGKIYITTFIDFQYGKLSESCSGHNNVFKSIKKHNLSDRVVGRVVDRVAHRDTDKDKDIDIDKEKDKDKENCDSNKKYELSFLEAWNSPGRNVRAIRSMTEKRRRSLLARLSEKIGDQSWWEVFSDVIETKFPLQTTLAGDSTWLPDGDWILKPGVVASIAEGKFDWTPGSNGKAKSEVVPI